MKIIKNVICDGRQVDIAVENGKIYNIYDSGSSECPDAEYVDFGGAEIYPGLIDIHSHGALGHDTMDADALDFLAEYYLKNGITTWYPTTMTMSVDDINAAVTAPYAGGGASILGFHFEGPFINAKRCGAQDPEYAIAPDASLFDSHECMKMITVAPETEGAIEYIKNCPAVVAIGHTCCDYDTARAAFLAGAKCLTHTFNARPGIHHRDPGPVIAGAECGAYAQLICDGIHIHPAVVRSLIKLYGTERVILISDSISATGLPDGEYTLGGQAVRMDGGVVTLREGVLAGSSVTLFECVRRAISFGIPKADAVKMASENPARLMGINKGVIAEGYDADFIIVDSDFNLVRAIARGEF